jgi:hypothetical protein
MNIFQKYLSLGLSVIPCKDKIPLFSWKKYQTEFATQEEAANWSGQIACICGAISSGLVVLDFDTKNGDHFNPWMELLTLQAPEILSKIAIEKTPSGGYHVVFRTGYLIKNVKLAWKAGNNQATIETRGEGGYFVCAPSENYILQEGDFSNLIVLSNEETEILINTARSLNENLEEKKEPEKNNNSQINNLTGITPLDDYDAKNDVEAILLKHGWKALFSRGVNKYYQRPGKDGRGISASWNVIPNRFYVFSTSTVFKNESVYKASAVYSILENGGDFVKTAKEFYAQGYGTRIEKSTPVDYDTAPTTQTVKISEFRERIYEFYRSPIKRGYFLDLALFDELLRFDKGYLNVITGIPTHGKSTVLDFLIMQLAKKHHWKTIMFSPENYPLEIHFNKLAEIYHGRSMWNTEKYIVDEAIDFIDSHFKFINATEEDLNLDAILSPCINAGIDCLIIDPWNEIESMRPKDVSESDFTGICLRKLRKFARKNNLCIIIVAHPTKISRIKDSKEYPVPSLYDISGSANWYNKTDNGFVVYRDFERDVIQIHVKKVKFKNYGALGMVEWKWNKETGLFTEITGFEAQTRTDF